MSELNPKFKIGDRVILHNILPLPDVRVPASLIEHRIYGAIGNVIEAFTFTGDPFITLVGQPTYWVDFYDTNTIAMESELMLLSDWQEQKLREEFDAAVYNWLAS